MSNSLAYKRNRTIDCTSSGSLLVTGNGGKSEVIITRSCLESLLELVAALALATAAYEVNAVKSNSKQVPAAIASTLHLIFMDPLSYVYRLNGHRHEPRRRRKRAVRARSEPTTA